MSSNKLSYRFLKVNNLDVSSGTAMQNTFPQIDSNQSDRAYQALSKAIQNKLGQVPSAPLDEAISFHCSISGQLLSEHAVEYLSLIASSSDQHAPNPDINLRELDKLNPPDDKIVNEMVSLVNKSKDRRDEIVRRIHDAAILKFSKHGLSGTSTNQIARQAGLSKAQLHYYIASKDDLYRTVLEAIMDEWDGLYLEATKTNDPKEILTTYITKKINHALDYPEATRLIAREVISGAPVLRAHWPEFRKRTDAAAELIQSWVDDKKIAPVNPYLLQINIWAITEYYAQNEVEVKFVLQIDKDKEINRDMTINESVQLFLTRCGI